MQAVRRALRKEEKLFILCTLPSLMRKIASGAKTLRLLSRQRATLKTFQPQRMFMRGSLAINMPHDDCGMRVSDCGLKRKLSQSFSIRIPQSLCSTSSLITKTCQCGQLSDTSPTATSSAFHFSSSQYPMPPASKIVAAGFDLISESLKVRPVNSRQEQKS